MVTLTLCRDHTPQTLPTYMHMTNLTLGIIADRKSGTQNPALAVPVAPESVRNPAPEKLVPLPAGEDSLASCSYTIPRVHELLTIHSWLITYKVYLHSLSTTQVQQQSLSCVEWLPGWCGSYVVIAVLAPIQIQLS